MKNWFIGPALTIFLSLPVQADSIRLATTTSTYNSGLLDHLLGHFRQVSETEIQVLAVGTGKALRLGENGDVDLVMTHAPAAEAEFVAAGFGIQPLAVMHNDFIIVGPQHDPAKLYGLQDVGQGLQAVADAQQRFLSRGDDSGTHKKELQLWRGILGGISSGQDIVARIALKPTSSLHLPGQSIDIHGNPVEVVTKGRHDPCVGIRATPIAEAMVALTLMDHFLRQRGQHGSKPHDVPLI